MPLALSLKAALSSCGAIVGPSQQQEASWAILAQPGQQQPSAVGQAWAPPWQQQGTREGDSGVAIKGPRSETGQADEGGVGQPWDGSLV